MSPAVWRHLCLLLGSGDPKLMILHTAPKLWLRLRSDEALGPLRKVLDRITAVGPNGGRSVSTASRVLLEVGCKEEVVTPVTELHMSSWPSPHRPVLSVFSWAGHSLPSDHRARAPRVPLLSSLRPPPGGLRGSDCVHRGCRHLRPCPGGSPESEGGVRGHRAQDHHHRGAQRRQPGARWGRAVVAGGGTRGQTGA